MMEFQNQYIQKAQEQKQYGDFHTAVDHLQKAILSDLSCPEAYEELGDNYISLREYKKAEKALLYALKLNDESANGHYLLGFLYSTQERWKESIDHLTQANNLMPNNCEIVRCLGWSHYNKGNHERGLALLERANNMEPEDINILCDLGVCYMNQDEYEKAHDIFENVIEIDQTSPQARECMMFLEMLKKVHPSA